MIKQSEDQIIDQIVESFSSLKISLLAPVVKGRKGHYRELFQQIRKMGYTKVRVDGEIQDLVPKMQLDRYKTHDVEIVIDRIKVDPGSRKRVADAVAICLKQGNGVMMTLDENDELTFFSRNLMDPESGLAYDDPAPNTFSFNSPYGACPECHGLGQINEISMDRVIPDPKLSISRGGIAPLGEYRDIWIFKKIEAILKRNNASISTPIKDLPEELIRIILHGDSIPVAVSSVKYPGTDWNTKFEGIITFLEKQKIQGTEKTREWIDDFTQTQTCPSCNGLRLKKEALHYRIGEMNIGELAQFDITNLSSWFEEVEQKMDERQNLIAREILKEIRKRIGFLLDVGLDYLSLDRPLKSLSGGEAQRIRLATQIGTQLVNVLYILDEPSIGLHQRDNMKLIHALKDLRDLGNTVIVVEHDKDMMLASDFVVDIGPGAGRHGGEIVAASHPDEFIKNDTLTSAYLNGHQQIAVPTQRRKGNGKHLVLKSAKGHNLKNVDLNIPLGKLVCITGVSGRGEAQRVKLATELSKKDTGKTFYILDEPTTGLHFQDIQHLLDVLEKLVEKGNTVLIVEHNMDVIKVADHIVDLGPDGGGNGGEVVASGTPESIAEGTGFTAHFLAKELAQSMSN
ncbi:uvrA [Symbiodinium microadriaticum]|nr:uvrA [Symbiodinium microadriaticum]